MSSTTRRSGLRVASASVAGLCALALCGVALLGSWQNSSTQDSTVRAERAGVAYTQSLIALINGLSAGDASAAAGRTADPGPIRGAVELVAAADSAYGGPLGTTGRWTDLRNRVEALTAGSRSGDPAAFSETTTLALELLDHVLAGAGLELDPDRDAHQLTAAAVRDLPSVMVHAAQTVPLPVSGTADRDQAATAAAVARYQVAVGAAGVSAAASELAASGTGAGMNAALAAQLDGFAAAVNAVAPPSVLGRLSSATADPSPDAVNRLETAALALDQAMLTQLDGQLVDRGGQLGAARRTILGEGLGVLVSVVAVLWLLSPRRTVNHSDAGPDGFDEIAEAPQIAFIAPRDLLGTEELVHVGRAVRARPAEHDDAG